MAGVQVSVDRERGIGCGICMERCFVRAIRIEEGKCQLDTDKCRACGRCTEECPVKAISITFDPSVIDAEADRIYALVNQ